MIIHYVAYGVLLTDEFGGPLNHPVCRFLVKDINQNKFGDEPNWLATCPSAEDYQMVLGFTFELSKKTDFSKLHKQWENLISELPAEIKETIPQLPDTDVHIMSGKC